MKFLILLLSSTMLIFANSLIVKDSDVIISLNNQEKNLQEKESLYLDNGTTICFKSGNGRVVINNKVQLMKAKRCYTIPLSKDFDINDYLLKVKTYVVALAYTNETVKHGVATKGINSLDDGKDINILNSDEDLVIYSKEFGPLPVIINLKDENENVILSVENEDSAITFLKIKCSTIKTKYKIEVLNGFNEIILNKRIIKNE